MTVVPPTGTTSEDTFKEMREAAINRDFSRMYGCLTVEARRDQISQLIGDIAVAGYRAEHDAEYRAAAPGRPPLTERQMKRAMEFLEVAKKYNFNGKSFVSSDPPEGSLDVKRRYYSRYASYVHNADAFVADGWNVMYAKGRSLFEPDAYLSDLKTFDDHAIAKVHGFHDRYGMDDHVYIHFKKGGGQWLVDMSPWWCPWGPPLSSVK